jgi:hypothetical protein
MGAMKTTERMKETGKGAEEPITSAIAIRQKSVIDCLHLTSY